MISAQISTTSVAGWRDYQFTVLPEKGSVYTVPGHTTVRFLVLKVDTSDSTPRVWMTDSLPQDVSDEEARELFQQHGSKWCVERFKGVVHSFR